MSKYGNEFDKYEPTSDQKQEFKDGIKTKNLYEKHYKGKETIQKIAHFLYRASQPWAPENKWEKNGYVKRQIIMNFLGIHISGSEFRKLIQIYREQPEKYNPKTIAGEPMGGFIIASQSGYRYECKDISKIEAYLKTLDERRKSINKQILAIEIQVEKIKQHQKWEGDWKVAEIKHEATKN